MTDDGLTTERERRGRRGGGEDDEAKGFGEETSIGGDGYENDFVVARECGDDDGEGEGKREYGEDADGEVSNAIGARGIGANAACFGARAV